MEATLEVAKVTSKGQVTIPIAIRKRLGVKTGGKLLFVQNPDDSVTIQNATVEAFEQARQAFLGAAEEAGLSSEQNVVDLFKEDRRLRGTTTDA